MTIALSWFCLLIGLMLLLACECAAIRIYSGVIRVLCFRWVLGGIDYLVRADSSIVLNRLRLLNVAAGIPSPVIVPLLEHIMHQFIRFFWKLLAVDGSLSPYCVNVTPFYAAGHNKVMMPSSIVAEFRNINVLEFQSELLIKPLYTPDKISNFLLGFFLVNNS